MPITAMLEDLARNWGWIELRGIVAVLFGVLALLWPGDRPFAAEGGDHLYAANGVPLPDRKEAEDALPEGGSLSGREIFERLLDNRLPSAVQSQTVFSSDPGGGGSAAASAEVGPCLRSSSHARGPDQSSHDHHV